MRKFAVGLMFVGAVALMVFANPFLATKTSFIDVVNAARLELGVNPTRTSLTQQDLEVLSAIGIINKTQASNLWTRLAAGSITTVLELVEVKQVGDSTAAQILMFFRLDMTGWKASK